MGNGRDLSRPPSLHRLANRKFKLEGEVHQLVTFLNRSLKYRGLIFGVTMDENGGYSLTIYRDPTTDYGDNIEEDGG